jgi:hypothetical protein
LGVLDGRDGLVGVALVEESGEGVELALVGAESVGGGTALIGQDAEVIVDQVGQGWSGSGSHCGGLA